MERPPESVRKALAAALGAEPDLVAEDAALPAGPGAYLLILGLSATASLGIPRFAGTGLEPGTYVYAGSARGPGGIRARVGRHLRSEKAVRWHIDHLTTGRRSIWANVHPDADECSLVARLLAGGAFETPLPGFGSSDCRSCTAHLLRFSAPVNPRR